MAEEKGKRVQWHSAFAASLQIELEEYAQYLRYEEEHLLSKKPLQMDILVVKNPADVEITKNLGRIFRKHNIVEYKSPEDNLSVDDFYKVYAYACLYKSETEKVNEIRADEITVTFACYHYPREMLRWIRKDRGIFAERQGEGLYYLKGDSIPMQLILMPELSKEDNYWMQTLRNDLDSSAEIRDLLANYEDKKQIGNYQALMDAVVRANWDRMEAERTMCDALRELFADELMESERKGEQRGEQRGRTEGRTEGRIEGRTEGETILGGLMQTLLAQKKYDEASRAAEDAAYRRELYKKYNIQI